MKPVILHSEAEAELREALHYYEGLRPGLGGEFLRAFEAAVHRIRENPQAYAIEADSGVRYCPMRRFPHTLVTLEQENRLWVVAVAHQKRRPHYWSDRSPG
jgi:plasmid stabilization system protein ParE